MKKNLVLTTPFIAMLTFVNICRAQAPMPQYHLKMPPSNIVIDGNIKEWGDSLKYYNPEERLNYIIANNKDTLYLAVKIYDRAEIVRVLNAGLTFSIDTRGKKRETFSLTYPLNVQGSGAITFNRNPGENDGVSQDERDELQREQLTTLRGIKVVGYKDIEDDMITTSNTYGIQTAVNYDAAGDLIYEEAIPLKFFHADVNAEWAFNIKINGIQRPQPTNSDNGEDGKERNGGDRSGGGSGGMGGSGGRHGGGRGGHTSDTHNGNTGGEMAKTIDFWGKFYLAK